KEECLTKGWWNEQADELFKIAALADKRIKELSINEPIKDEELIKKFEDEFNKDEHWNAISDLDVCGCAKACSEIAKQYAASQVTNIK
ncbi:MAG: hypothetical protein ABI091_30400, partial [Ferruginibacter sp.]